jgi:hypothetical protein
LDIDVDRVMFDADRLVVTIASLSAKKSWTVTFAATLGHRVLDEGDLLEFWPHCSRPNGWLFQIDAGGWFEQECARQGFLARDTQSGIQEYFVAGDNTCVNVLSWEPPKVTRCES